MRSRVVVGSLLFTSFLSAGFARADLAAVMDSSPLTQEESAQSSAWPAELTGEIRDPQGKLIPDVSLVIDGHEYFGDKQGNFRIPTAGSKSALLIKKPGYRKLKLQPRSGGLNIELAPQTINAVYVPWGELDNSASLQNLLSLIERTELNAVVVDVKDDGGGVHTKLQPGVDFLHQHDVYTIGRVTTFKDTKYTKAHPDLGLQSKSGGLWTDKKGNSYLNPYDDRAQDYVISVAKMAAGAGFDEIQFDYVRFPTDGDIKSIAFTEPYDADHRTDAIGRFAERARAALGPMGVFVAADLFGIAAYEKNDLSKEGQNVEKISAHVDYLCPMVYPSGYGAGPFYNIQHPVDQPKDIVEDSVRRYRLRASDDAVVRPWLQAFRDYAYNHREYGATEIRDQIDGSDSVGGQGFLLWNANGHYSDAGLKPKKKTLN